MSASLSQTEFDALTALRTFLIGILPTGIEVIRAEINRVPEPPGLNYVVMTPLTRDRLSTNIETYADVILTGSIAGTTLTVTAINLANLAVGQALFGPGIATGSIITALGSGTGGIGTYLISPAQIISSQQIYAGTKANLQPTQVTVQLDVHGPVSADNAQIISTLFRDDYANRVFAESGYAIQPLYTSDAKQLPFINGEDQYEFRWTMDVILQTNQTVTIPQEFSDQVSVDLVSVEAAYPVGG